jgi:RNA polymerase sigma factor (sigma-70 family)
MEPRPIKYDAETLRPPLIDTIDNSLTAQLYTCYAAKLLTYISKNMQSSVDAEDLLFEVFLAVIEREHDLEMRLEDERRAWLWSVAHNKIIDSYRRSQRRENVPLESVKEMLDEEWLPEQTTLRHEEHQLLHTHLQSLPTIQQELLYLRFTAGLRSAEIAVILHKSEAAVRKMLSRTLNTLRTIYER